MLEYQKKWFKYAIDDWQTIKKINSNINYLVSFPKCGRTWLLFMLSEIVRRAYDIKLDQPTIKLNEITKNHSNLPTILQTHDDSSLTDEKGNLYDVEKLFIYGGRLKYLRNKVILLVRDPRDVAVSHYHQITRRVKNNPIQCDSISEFIHHPLYGLERIIRFYQIWNRNRSIPQDFLLIRYEDLTLNGINSLQSIIEFINLRDVDFNLIQNVYEYSQAEKMRKLEITGKIRGMNFLNTDQNSLKVRSAKIGSYLDELSDEDINYCNGLMRKVPKIYGYTI